MLREMPTNFSARYCESECSEDWYCLDSTGSVGFFVDFESYFCFHRYCCPICNATGDDAHTVTYCPKVSDGSVWMLPGRY